MNNELKPCPFCGSGRMEVKLGKVRYSMMCKNCFAEGGSASTEEGAIAAWNRRTPANEAERSEG